MIQIKSETEIGLMRRAGVLVGETLERLRDAVQPGVSTDELDALAEQHIRDGGGVPSFLGYHPRSAPMPYPATLCLSVNDIVVHGIPDETTLDNGDIISIDCGAQIDGYHGDAAVTAPVGQVDDGLGERAPAERRFVAAQQDQVAGRTRDPDLVELDLRPLDRPCVPFGHRDPRPRRLEVVEILGIDRREFPCAACVADEAHRR